MLKKILLGIILSLLAFYVGCSNVADADLSLCGDEVSQKGSDISETLKSISESEVLNNVEHHEVNDVLFIIEQDAYPVNANEISYTIKNNKQTKYFFPAYTFSLERYVDDKWISVSVDTDYVFKTLDRSLAPGEEATGTINLENCYNLPLEKGIYRISKRNLKSESFEIK